jgi:GTP-binding protein
MPLEVIDTGGLDDRGAVSSQVQTQVELAMNESDVVLFMLDSRAGVTALDLHFARWIRKIVDGKYNPTNNSKKEIIILANKAEGAHMSEQVMDTVSEACRLGFGEPLLISASHGYV